MPTIGQLPQAASVSDTDELPVFQNGQTVAATRAQILAGMQSNLAVPPGTLLGGVGPGTGAPTPIAIGSNLQLSGSTLSASAAPFEISSLRAGTSPAADDFVALGQGGSNVSVSYATFLAGLKNVSGVDGSVLEVTAEGTTSARTLAAIAGDAVSIEDFGAVGDGTTDDGAALRAALATGSPVRFGPKTYRIDGECDVVGAAAVLLGVPGLTVLMRGGQSLTGTSSNPAWISVSATRFVVDGIIFDANRAVTADTWGVVLQAGCLASDITRCTFRNAMGSIYGWGLAIAPSDPTLTRHTIHDCTFTANAVDGIWVAATDGVVVSHCHAYSNARHGIYVDSQDPTFALKIRKVQVIGNTCWDNQTGIVIGNFNATNRQPGTYGNANPDVLAALVACNTAYNNSSYGISISGRNILVTGNLLVDNGPAGGGMLANTGYCRVEGNMIVGSGGFGIDAGGSIFTDLSNNYVNGAIYGIGIGGSQNCVARNNFIQDCSTAIIAVNVESDGRGDNFGISCNNLSLAGNRINYGSGGQGIVLRDAPQTVLVSDNTIVAEPGADPLEALVPYTDSLIVRGNLINFSDTWPANPAVSGGQNRLVYPDIVDTVDVTQTTAAIDSMVSAAAIKSAGQVTYIKVTNGGSGYTTATVSITGSGSGATATAFIAGGVIIGIAVTAGGSGYGSGTVATIAGDGSGATLAVQVGLPVLERRRLTVRCMTSVPFAAAGSLPAQENWTGATVTVPQGAAIVWRGAGGAWQAESFVQSDYLVPASDSSVVLQSPRGDVALRPASGHSVHLISPTEPTGCALLIGRGSPEGAVLAVPGSTYRNLDGGVGATFWVKQTGTSSSGWAAIG